MCDSDSCPLALAPESLSEGAICSASMWLSPTGIRLAWGGFSPLPWLPSEAHGVCVTTPHPRVRSGQEVTFAFSKAGGVQTESGNS